MKLLRYMLGPFPADTQRRAMRHAAKAIARHRGWYSKYDGKGNRQDGFPILSPDTSRIPNPNSRNYLK